MEMYGMPYTMYEHMNYQPEPRKTYAVTLSDNTRLDNLELNGNNYVTKDPITRDMFVGNTRPVTVEVFTEGEETPRVEEHPYMDLVHFYYDEQEQRTYFVLMDVSAREIQIREMLSNVDYLLMMSDE